MDERRPAAHQSPWLPFETRRRARDEKREAVLRTAVRLFLEQGYSRATLDGVAERLNITKSSLYNYFRSKDEILFECWVGGQEALNQIIAAIDEAGGTGLAKLSKLIHSYAKAMTSDRGASLVRFDLRDLADKNKEIVRAGRKKIDLTFRKYVTDGIADGSIKPCDSKLTAFAIAGSLNWIGHWYQPGGALSGEAIAAEFAIRLTEGLAKRKPRKKTLSTAAENRRPRRRSR